MTELWVNVTDQPTDRPTDRQTEGWTEILEPDEHSPIFSLIILSDSRVLILFLTLSNWAKWGWTGFLIYLNIL